ncbi:SRPBCC family protein [Stackebrandtia nassauensis]|uniref:SRPBCC family protein n=1 Tax=Stackebrandtia nassauensis TaxID=283811 RepID=UPI000693D72E
MFHHVTLAVKAPVDLVWRTIADLEDWPKWTPTVTSVKPSHQDGLRVGDTAEVVQPKQRDRVWTITEVKEGESFTWKASDPGGLRLSADHIAKPGPDGTTVVELTFDLAGPTAFLAKLLAGATIRKFVDTEAKSLKEWCEQHA